jgi:hypothetical protein
MTSSTSADASSSAAPANTGYGRLARQISGWTTNLLATAIVLVAGIALGWQVLVWWAEAVGERVAAPINEAFMERFSGGEFTTGSGQFKAEQLEGDEVAAFAAMREWCLGTASIPDAREPGPGEAELLASLGTQQPLEVAGDLALYEPPERLAGLPPMLIAVSQSRERIVAWSFALPAVHSRDQRSRTEDEVGDVSPAIVGEGTRNMSVASWSLYHFRPTPGSLTPAPHTASIEILESNP